MNPANQGESQYTHMEKTWNRSDPAQKWLAYQNYSKEVRIIQEELAPMLELVKLSVHDSKTKKRLTKKVIHWESSKVEKKQKDSSHICHPLDWWDRSWSFWKSLVKCTWVMQPNNDPEMTWNTPGSPSLTPPPSPPPKNKTKQKKMKVWNTIKYIQIDK